MTGNIFYGEVVCPVIVGNGWYYFNYSSVEEVQHGSVAIAKELLLQSFSFTPI
jgi:hypothetical protein